MRIFILILVVVLAQGFHINSLETVDCPNPKIIEFQFNYTLPTDDLQTLTTNNLSSINIEDIKNKNVTFTSVKLELAYKGGKLISPTGSLQVQVQNDSFSGALKWAVEVKKTIGKEDFNVTAQVKLIPVKYIKTYILDKKQYQITNLTYTFTNDMIVNITITPNDSHKTTIDQITKNQLYNAINMKLKSLQGWLNDIASKQKIGQLFNSDKYDYKFYNWTLPIDTSSILVTISGNDLINGFKGDFIGDASGICPTGVPSVQPGFRMFISLSFIQSLAKSTFEKYTPYKNVKIDSSNTRTSYFQFKFIDLEYVFGGLPNKYQEHFMKPVSFGCSITQITSAFTKSGKLIILAKWNCLGYLIIDSQNHVKIIDSEIFTSHELYLGSSTNYLTVYNNIVTVIQATFNPVQDIVVKNTGLAKYIINEFLNDLRSYIPGTYFKTPTNPKIIKIASQSQEADGIWVG